MGPGPKLACRKDVIKIGDKNGCLGVGGDQHIGICSPLRERHEALRVPGLGVRDHGDNALSQVASPANARCLVVAGMHKTLIQFGDGSLSQVDPDRLIRTADNEGQHAGWCAMEFCPQEGPQTRC